MYGHKCKIVVCCASWIATSLRRGCGRKCERNSCLEVTSHSSPKGPLKWFRHFLTSYLKPVSEVTADVRTCYDTGSAWKRIWAAVLKPADTRVLWWYPKQRKFTNGCGKSLCTECCTRKERSGVGLLMWKTRRIRKKLYKEWCRYVWLKRASNIYIFIGKGKAVPLQAWSGPEGSRKLRFPDFTQGGGKVVSLTRRPNLPAGNPPGTHFC